MFVYSTDSWNKTNPLSPINVSDRTHPSLYRVHKSYKRNDWGGGSPRGPINWSPFLVYCGEVAGPGDKYGVRPPVTWNAKKSTLAVRKAALRKLYFQYLSHWLGYDRGDGFPLDFEPNGFTFDSNRNENYHHDYIPFNVKRIGSIVFSVWCLSAWWS